MIKKWVELKEMESGKDFFLVHSLRLAEFRHGNLLPEGKVKLCHEPGLRHFQWGRLAIPTYLF